MPDTVTAYRFVKLSRFHGYPVQIFGLGYGCVIVPREGDTVFFTAMLGLHADEDSFFTAWGKWGRHDIALFIYPVESAHGEA